MEDLLVVILQGFVKDFDNNGFRETNWKAKIHVSTHLCEQ